MAVPGEVTNTEAISRAVVQERMGKVTADAHRDAVAGEMVRRADEANWREGLQFGAEREVSRQDVFSAVDQIGAERDIVGKRVRNPGSDEETRHRNATAAAELSLKFSEKGYVGLDQGEKDKVRAKITNIVLQNPALDSEFRALSIADQRVFLERIANDNAYVAEVKNALNTIAENPSLDDSASEKQLVLDQRTTEQAVKKSELVDVQRRLTAVESRLKAFDISTTPPGAQSQEMDRIRAALPTLQVEAASYQQEMKDLNFRLGQLQVESQGVPTVLKQGTTYIGRSKIDINNDVVAARNSLKSATDNFNQRVAEINKLPLLEQEQERLEDQRLNLARDEAEKKIAASQAEGNLTRAQREFQDALERRQRQEQELVASLDRVFSTGAMELFDKQIEAYGEQFEESLKSVNTEAMSEDEKAVIKGLEGRWQKTILKRRFGGRTEPRRVEDKAKINNEFNSAMTDDDAYLRTVLSETINPRTNNPYTVTEVDTIFANEDLMKKIKPEVFGRLIARKAVVGGIEIADVYELADRTWGKDVIKVAIANNDEFRKLADQLIGKGAVDQPDFMEKLKREAENHPGLLAALAAALAAAGGAVIGAGFLGAAAGGALAGGAARAGASYNKGNQMFG